MKYVCPACGSENILPIYPQDNIWQCVDCGYKGPAQIIRDHLEEMWKIYRNVSVGSKRL